MFFFHGAVLFSPSLLDLKWLHMTSLELKTPQYDAFKVKA